MSTLSIHIPQVYQTPVACSLLLVISGGRKSKLHVGVTTNRKTNPRYGSKTAITKQISLTFPPWVLVSSSIKRRIYTLVRLQTFKVGRDQRSFFFFTHTYLFIFSPKCQRSFLFIIIIFCWKTMACQRLTHLQRQYAHYLKRWSLCWKAISL